MTSKMLQRLLQLLVGGSNAIRGLYDEGFYLEQPLFPGDMRPSPIFLSMGFIVFDPMMNQDWDLFPFSHILTSFFRGIGFSSP